MDSSSAYIWKLARSFPCLARKIPSNINKDFDADVFIDNAGGWSSGEIKCALFIVNVWNPSYAKSKEWRFDLFAFAGTADSANMAALQEWLSNPIFP